MIDGEPPQHGEQSGVESTRADVPLEEEIDAKLSNLWEGLRAAERLLRGESRLRGPMLCLSGGGFRAVAFHLGALRLIAHLGLLGKVEVVRSVSGGSILAAFLAGAEVRSGRDLDELDFEGEIARPVRNALGTDLRAICQSFEHSAGTGGRRSRAYGRMSGNSRACFS